MRPAIKVFLVLCFLFSALSAGLRPSLAKERPRLKVAAATAELGADDSMSIAGNIFPFRAKGQEGQLRASAIVIEENTKVAIVSCDVVKLSREIDDAACREIEARTGIPSRNILISATHTHHAPSTSGGHSVPGDQVFSDRVKEAIVSAVSQANEKLRRAKPSQLYFALGQEATVGQNSRLLLGDGTIYWVGPMDDAVRPTGPFDPELPVLAFKDSAGAFEAMLFNHSSHNIGARSAKRSPGFYGLAAQELEKEVGGTVIFLVGAAGSTHVLPWSFPTDEKILRIKAAVKSALSDLQPRQVGTLESIKQEFPYQVRRFDEEQEDKAVSFYCNKRIKANPERTIENFRQARKTVAPHQGESRKTWLQMVRIGDVAFVGVPGEFFTKLGIQIKRRSPFRYTYVVELANDCLGYIPDKEAYGLGGYQVWTGTHSYVAKGTGEAIVEESLRLLNDAYKRMRQN
jgi:hypothetical protein